MVLCMSYELFIRAYPDEQFSLELAEETGSRQRRVAKIRRSAADCSPVSPFRRLGSRPETRNVWPIAGQASPWNDEVKVSGRTQMSMAGCCRHWDAHVGQVRRRVWRWHLPTSEHNLNWMCWRTGSQCRSSRRVSVMWSNLHLPVMRHAAALITD